MAARRKATQYAWGKNKPYQGDAQVVGNELARIQVAYGVLKPEMVVKEAAAEDSPLHSHFEWDDTIAAEAHREAQARSLIRAVVVKIPDEPDREVRGFLVVHQEAEGNFYLDTNTVMSEPDYRSQVLQRAKSELSSFKRKYRNLNELAGVFRAIDELEA